MGEVEEESPYTFYDGLLTFSKYGLTKEYYFDNEDNIYPKYIKKMY